jgi:multimeric flavodoxin WrbA
MTTSLKALILNCTLKASPSISNTDALIQQIIKLYKKQNIRCEVIRPADYVIKYGISADEGNGDQWPIIYNKIKQCNILLIASPTWSNGHQSSICTQIFERLNDTYYNDLNPKTGQYMLYNKVGGAIVTGNEDGALNIIKYITFNLNEFGATIPPNSTTYWNKGNKGTRISYIDANGKSSLNTNRMNHYMVHNTSSFAKLLQKSPIKTNLIKLNNDAKKVSN